jgi:ATP-dependent Clp protease ATP-binding subunit ClpC
VFERFTEPARQAVVLAQDEARALKHNYIGTEHILLGLLRDEDGLASRVLDRLGVSLSGVREQVGRIVGPGEVVTTGQIPFTPRAKKVLELSLKEAIALGHNHIGTEHLLLAIVRENEGVAVRILLDHDADAEKVRVAALELIGGEVPERYEQTMREAVVRSRIRPALKIDSGSALMLIAGAGLFVGGLLVGRLTRG